jgi:phosphinothricin acetyltransferase
LSLHARTARLDDAPVIAVIYNQGIEDRIATFEIDARTADTIARMITTQATYPVVVVELEGAVAGAAWTAEYRPRRAYAGVAEVSVYVARDARGQGVGRAALNAIIEAAEAAGFWKLVSRIFPENAASRRLCASVGFREVGIYRRHGKLDGRWRDCVIVERLLGPALREDGA